jgi:multiple sugar transport system substrate-binding protein
MRDIVRGPRAYVAIGIVLVAAVLAAALFGAVSILPPKGGGAGAQPSVTPTVVRWFVGLTRSGSQTDESLAAAAAVAHFNATNRDGIRIVLESVPNADAFDVLKTEIASGNAPDIIGPVSDLGLVYFDGLLLDLRPEIARHHYDLGAFDPSLVAHLNRSAAPIEPNVPEGQIGLPYQVYPEFILYNSYLLAQAGLPKLPTKVGQTYQGQAWDWNALGSVAARLTLDDKGRDSTDPNFDARHIVQFGLDFPDSDPRWMASGFGSGSLVRSDFRTPQIPETWLDAWTWYYEAMWTHHYAPTSSNRDGATMAAGSVAMVPSWTWDLGTYLAPGSKAVSWDLAVMPSWRGQTTSPSGIDAFAIPKASAHPDAAFQAMVGLMADPSLAIAYGGMPARTAGQDAYLQTLAVRWSSDAAAWPVLEEMARYPATPGPDRDIPNFQQADSDCATWYANLQARSGLDMATEEGQLLNTLQTDFLSPMLDG